MLLTRLAFSADTIERQREHISKLRTKLQDPDNFRRVYNFSFDYAKAEGQKGMRASPLYYPEAAH